MSAHALVVISMSASLPCSGLLSLVCSPLTVPPYHPSHPRPSPPRQPDKHSTNCYSHVSSSKVLQSVAGKCPNLDHQLEQHRVAGSDARSDQQHCGEEQENGGEDHERDEINAAFC